MTFLTYDVQEKPVGLKSVRSRHMLLTRITHSAVSWLGLQGRRTGHLRSGEAEESPKGDPGLPLRYGCVDLGDLEAGDQPGCGAPEAKTVAGRSWGRREQEARAADQVAHPYVSAEWGEDAFEHVQESPQAPIKNHA